MNEGILGFSRWKTAGSYIYSYSGVSSACGKTMPQVAGTRGIILV